MKINPRKMLYCILALFPSILMLDGFLSRVSDIAVAFIFMSLLMELTKRSALNYKILLICVLIISTFCLVLHRVGTEGIRDYLKLITFCWLALHVSQKNIIDEIKVYIEEHSILIKTQIYSLVVINIYLLFLPSSYDVMYGLVLLKGNMYHTHTYAYYVSSFILLVMISNVTNTEKIALISFCIFLVLRTGVRSVLLFIAIVIIAQYGRNLKRTRVAFVVCILLFLTYPFLRSTEIFSKTSEALKYGSATSGRDIIWKADLQCFVNSTLLEKVIGHGYEFPYRYHESVLSMAIWSHNDFLHLLLVGGLVLTLIYIVSLYVYFYKCRIGFLYILAVIILIMSNGVFVYSEMLPIIAYLPITSPERRFTL